jgi:hypothetical protein
LREKNQSRLGLFCCQAEAVPVGDRNPCDVIGAHVAHVENYRAKSTGLQEQIGCYQCPLQAGLRFHPLHSSAKGSLLLIE